MLGVEGGGGPVSVGAEAAPALEERVAPGRHRRDLTIAVVHLGADVVQPLSAPIQELMTEMLGPVTGSISSYLVGPTKARPSFMT